MTLKKGVCVCTKDHGVEELRGLQGPDSLGRELEQETGLSCPLSTANWSWSWRPCGLSEKQPHGLLYLTAWGPAGSTAWNFKHRALLE